MAVFVRSISNGSMIRHAKAWRRCGRGGAVLCRRSEHLLNHNNVQYTARRIVQIVEIMYDAFSPDREQYTTLQSVVQYSIVQ